MRTTFRRMIAATGLLLAAALQPLACAQAPGGPSPAPGTYASSSSAILNVITFSNVRVQTTVRVPDGGNALVGGYSRVSEGRGEFGSPVLGRVPVVGRGFRNIGYGRSVVSGKAVASVRVINLHEEEYRQTGVRSR